MLSLYDIIINNKFTTFQEKRMSTLMIINKYFNNNNNNNNNNIKAQFQRERERERCTYNPLKTLMVS